MSALLETCYESFFAPLIMPGTAMARDHDPLAGLGIAVIMGIGVVVWVIGTMLFKALSEKKPIKKTEEPEASNHVNREGR